MGLPNSTAIAALGEQVVYLHYVGWFDFNGDVVRRTTAPGVITFAGTGDADLDGFTYVGGDTGGEPCVVSLSPIEHRENGSETLSLTLSGQINTDPTLLATLEDRTNWQGRQARLWGMLFDSAGNRVGNVWPIYSGYMSGVSIGGSPEGQAITVSIESYLASLSQPSNRTYLCQKDYDSGDLSAAKSIAIANGTSALGNAGVAAGAGAGLADRLIRGGRHEV